MNWDTLLTLVVCYITSSQQAAESFKSELFYYPWTCYTVPLIASEYIISDVLAQATSCHEGDMLLACLIFARQAALEGAHVHPPYQKWFQVHACTIINGWPYAIFDWDGAWVCYIRIGLALTSTPQRSSCTLFFVIWRHWCPLNLPTVWR